MVHGLEFIRSHFESLITKIGIKNISGLNCRWKKTLETQDLKATVQQI